VITKNLIYTLKQGKVREELNNETFIIHLFILPN
jgi:hypothetical protein